MSTLTQLIALGFDACTRTSTGYRVRCTACDALIIQGTPTHEAGCPNAKHECRGCNELIPKNQRYCEDCRT